TARRSRRPRRRALRCARATACRRRFPFCSRGGATTTSRGTTFSRAPGAPGAVPGPMADGSPSAAPRPGRAPGARGPGPVSHDEVVSWIHAADVGAVPSYYEGCGVALLEMLAGGLYVLSHDVGIAPEVIRSGANGAVVAQHDAAWTSALIDTLERRPRG